MLKIRFLTPLLITSVLVACGSDNSGGPDGGGGEGGQTSETGGSSSDGVGGEGGAGDLPSDAEETIGQDGGTVETEAAQLSFPAGALPAGVEITVAGLDPSEVEDLPPTSEDIILAAIPVAFLPHGLTFDEPVAVVLSYDAQAVGDVQLVVMKLDNAEDTTWEVVPGAVFENGQAHFEITSFSVYGVFEDPKGTADELYSGDLGTGGSSGSAGTEGTGGDEGSGGQGSGGDEGSGGSTSTSAGGAGQAGGTGAGGAGQGGGTSTGGAGPGGGTGAGGAGQAGGTGAGGAGQGGGTSTGTGGLDAGTGGDDGQGGGMSTGGSAQGGGPGAGGASQGGTTGAGGGGIGMGGVGGIGGGPGGDENPGYLTAGAWHGYGWTYATDGSEISSDVGYRAAPNCANGHTAAGFEQLAVLGYNINESLDGGDDVPTLVTGDGVYVELDTFWAREHRIQLSADGGAKTWCAQPPGSGFIPWENFSTTCWTPGGEVFNPALDAVESVGVVVPGTDVEQGFDFCLNELRPGLEPTYGYFVHDGFQGDGYIETSGDTQVFGQTVSSSFVLPVSASGDFTAAPGSDVTLWFNVFQSEPGGDVGMIVPAQDGVQVALDAYQGEWMQVVISDGTTTWCAPHYGSWNEFVPWSEFNTDCADGSGSPYAFEPFSALGVRFWPSPENLQNGWTEFDVTVTNFFERTFQDEGYLEQGEWLETQGEECFEGPMGEPECFPTGNYGPSWRGYGALGLVGGATGSTNVSHVNDGNYCASGTLPAGIDAGAELLFSLNQDRAGSLLPPVTVTREGARIQVSNNGAASLQAILVAENGTRYCYPISGNEDFVPWEAFNTECDGSGVMLFPDVLLTHAGIAAAPDFDNETAFNFCFQGMEARNEPVYGYLDGFDFHGQGAISVGGTTQVFYENLTSQDHPSYCMEGQLGASSEDFARMRFGANQQPGGPEQLAFPQGDGINVSYQRMYEETARVVLSAEAQDFCADLADPFSQNIVWQDFVACDGSGTPYAGEPFSAISLEVVPGASTAFYTCLDNLRHYEEGSGGGMGGAGSGTGGAGPGGGLVPPKDRTNQHPGYLDDGIWSGAAQTFATPMSDIQSDIYGWDGPLACASGFVGAPWEEFAVVGYDIADGAPTLVTGEGVWVELHSSQAREHRLNVVNQVTGQYWCANVGLGLAPGPVFVPWGSLNSSCWDGLGASFDQGTNELTRVEVQVPSTGAEEQFEFCIDRLQSGLSGQF